MRAPAAKCPFKTAATPTAAVNMNVLVVWTDQSLARIHAHEQISSFGDVGTAYDLSGSLVRAPDDGLIDV